LLLGEDGFLLPENQIIPTGQETLAGELALLRYIEEHVLGGSSHISIHCVSVYAFLSFSFLFSIFLSFSY
jgi:hypothetical protein